MKYRNMISIITPVYQGERFIEACIKNVIDQNLKEMEHIIIDGGSNDQTVDIVKSYAKRYKHIKWISEKDRGQSDAMNKGIAMSTGEIIGILNVDDYYEPNTLNRVLEIFKILPEPSFLVGNCNMLGDDEEIYHINKPKKLKLIDLVSMTSPFPVNPSAYFYHKSLHTKVQLYELNEHYAMDLDFILKAIQAANVKYIDEVWGNYRQIQGTKTVTSMQNGHQAKVLNQIMKKYRDKLPFFQRIWATWGFIFIRRVQYFSRKPKDIIPSLRLRINSFKLG